jgi:hypothetical protein
MSSVQRCKKFSLLGHAGNVNMCLATATMFPQGIQLRREEFAAAVNLRADQAPDLVNLPVASQNRFRLWELRRPYILVNARPLVLTALAPYLLPRRRCAAALTRVFVLYNRGHINLRRWVLRSTNRKGPTVLESGRQQQGRHG